MSLESILLALVSYVVGGLTTFALFSGRVSTLEANYKSLDDQLKQLRKDISTQLSGLTTAITNRGLPVRHSATFDDEGT